jgi:o-succinylbenzoate synthase
MRYNISFEKKVFHFKRPSGTSRGILTEKKCWLLSIYDSSNPAIKGVGECSIIEGLSPDFENDEQYEAILEALVNDPELDLSNYPSIKFGLESALLDLKHGGNQMYFDNDFANGKQKIPINGLVWMGDEVFMQEQIAEKLAQGFKTIKMKIGAIDLETELRLLSAIRNKYSREEITLRVDANGAFQPEDAMIVLEKLNELDIHSIEQPIKPGQWNEMSKLCLSTPTPIALDEELIGINNAQRKIELLETIRPQFIILKPSLHGGISGAKEWITLAEKRFIPWWMTSALESNIGLKAIAQLTAEYNVSLPQGLGTGSLYTDNIPSNLVVENGFIYQKN